jgi:hypothetical protein
MRHMITAFRYLKGCFDKKGVELLHVGPGGRSVLGWQCEGEAAHGVWEYVGVSSYDGECSN